jgi:hypothetical protein
MAKKRIVQLPNISKAKRGRGRTEGDTRAKGDFMRWIVGVVLPHAERQLKEAEWVYGFRQEAERQVVQYLISKGYDEKFVRSLKFPNSRRRGKKKKKGGNPKAPAR